MLYFLHGLSSCSVLCLKLWEIKTYCTNCYIVFEQTSLRPFLVDPSSRATEWLKVHLKENRLEVVNQQVSFSFALDFVA